MQQSECLNVCVLLAGTTNPLLFWVNFLVTAMRLTIPVQTVSEFINVHVPLIGTTSSLMLSVDFLMKAFIVTNELGCCVDFTSAFAAWG